MGRIPTPEEETQRSRIIRTLDRGLIILEALRDEAKDVSLSELTARFPWDKSTTHRLLATLVRRGYVEQDPGTCKYRLGLKIMTLNSALMRRLDIKHRASEFVEELALTSRETAHLAVFDRGEAVIVAQTDSPEKVRIYTYVGMRLPAHCTALGKALLAAVRDEQVNQWLAENRLEGYTEKTLTDAEQLKAHLREIRQQGYAFDDEEYDPGIRCLACPVKNSEGGVVAAVGISGPSHRLPPDRLERYIQLVKATAGKTSTSMGFVPESPRG